MTEQLVVMDEEEILHRNKMLRGKKRGMLLATAILIAACSTLLYLLQYSEQVEGQPLYIATGVMTAISLLGVLLYRRFVRKLNRDMQSHEKIVTIGIVVRSNFIGNTVYATTTFGNDGRKYITLDINGRWMNLSGIQVKRLLPEVWQANRILPGNRFLLEFTPYGRHLMTMQLI